MSNSQIRARVDQVTVRRPRTHPLAALLSAKLARLIGSDLNGSRGTIRWGDPSQLGGIKATGYVQPPQNYAGAGRLRQGKDGGAIRAGMRMGGLPGSQAPYSEMSAQLAQIAAGQNGGLG